MTVLSYNCFVDLKLKYCFIGDVVEEMLMVYITNPSKKAAKDLAAHLLNKRLIACANIFSGNSMYWWEGQMAKEDEVVLIAKTVEGNFDALKHEAEDFSDYQVPCIIKIPVTANQQFVHWLRSEIRT